MITPHNVIEIILKGIGYDLSEEEIEMIKKIKLVFEDEENNIVDK